MKGLGQLMKQAQEMQANIEKAQAELESLEVQGESGGGMVKVRMTCKYQVRAIDIEQALLGDEKDMLEDLVAAAVNDATRKVAVAVQDRMSSITGGMQLPGGMKLPF